MITVSNKIQNDNVGLLIVRAINACVNMTPVMLYTQLISVIDKARRGLSGEQEKRRRDVRDILRNGVYKPTGRGKPANEYLLSAAAGKEKEFPRVNGIVDAVNYISLKYMLPISLWDIDAAGTSSYVFRLGKEGERYVFNSAGQEIDLRDMIVGCKVPVPDIDMEGEPIVNPVKDSLGTKTNDESYHVAAVVYFPIDSTEQSEMEHLAEELEALLVHCGEKVKVCHSIIRPDETRSV